MFVSYNCLFSLISARDGEKFQARELRASIADVRCGLHVVTACSFSLGENNFPTNSMMIRKKNDGHYPEFYYNCPVGDYPMQVYMSFLGTVHYIDEFMSCYRINADSSWTNRIQSSDEKTLNMYSKMIASLEGMDSFSEGRYHNEISDRINTYKLLSALIKHDIKGVYSSWGKVQVKKLPRSVQLGMIIPTVYYLLRRRRTKKREKKYKNK
jgi:hypothetical protein